MQIFTEKYRPNSFKDIIGQEKIVERVEAMTKEKNISNLLFTGPPGSGKTSLILAIAKELYGKNWKENVMETNAAMDRGINHIRNEIKDFSRTKSMDNVPHKLCILDEADALTKEAQHALRRTMEIYSNNVRFCLLVNYSSKIVDAIQSRCTVFRFKKLELDHVKKLVNRIAKEEKIKINDRAIDALYEISEGDLRRAINILQSCAVLNKNITEKIVYELVSFAEPKEIKEILELAINGNFIKARDKLLDTMLKHGLSGLDAIKQIQKEILKLDIKDELKARLTEKCGEIEFRMVEGSDEYLQLEVLLASFSLIK